MRFNNRQNSPCAEPPELTSVEKVRHPLLMALGTRQMNKIADRMANLRMDTTYRDLREAMTQTDEEVIRQYELVKAWRAIVWENRSAWCGPPNEVCSICECGYPRFLELLTEMSDTFGTESEAQ